MPICRYAMGHGPSSAGGCTPVLGHGTGGTNLVVIFAVHVSQFHRNGWSKRLFTGH